MSYKHWMRGSGPFIRRCQAEILGTRFLFRKQRVAQMNNIPARIFLPCVISRFSVTRCQCISPLLIIKMDPRGADRSDGLESPSLRRSYFSSKTVSLHVHSQIKFEMFVVLFLFFFVFFSEVPMRELAPSPLSLFFFPSFPLFAG